MIIVPKRGAACSLVKLIYIEAEGELRRIGPRYILKHYLTTYGSKSIQIKGYTVQGSKAMKEIDMIIEITIENEENTLHEVFSKSLSKIKW